MEVACGDSSFVTFSCLLTIASVGFADFVLFGAASFLEVSALVLVVGDFGGTDLNLVLDSDLGRLLTEDTS